MQREGRAVAVFPPQDDDEDATATLLAGIEDGALDVAAADAPRLASLLAHPDRVLRRRASGALGAAVARGSIPVAWCESLLGAADAATRWGAAFALAASGHRGPGVIEASLAALDSDDGDVRWAAASLVIAEARVSAEFGASLRRLAKSGTPTMRKMALLCLGDSGDSGDGQRSALLEALGDADAMVRLAALTALARSGDASSSTLNAIAAVADGDSEARVQRAASAVLRRLQSPL